MLIVMSHCGILEIDGGALSVSFFFILSGFLTEMKYKNHEYALHKRLKKIYSPVLFLSLTISLFIYIYINKINNYKSVLIVLSNYFLIGNWFDFQIINSVTWFLCDLVFFYVFYPIIKKYDKKNNPLLRVCLIIAIKFFIETNFSYLSNYYFLTYKMPLYRLFDFYIGILLFNIKKATKVNIINKYISTFLVIVYMIINDIFTYTYIQAILSCYIIYSFSNNDVVNTNRCPVLSLFLYLGKNSFNIYLLHWPILELLRLLKINTNNILILILIISISIFIPILLFKEQNK